MALDRTDHDATLRPSRWPARPAGGSALRWALVAALLTLAVGVLYLGQPSCTDSTTAGLSSGSPSPTRPAGTAASAGPDGAAAIAGGSPAAPAGDPSGAGSGSSTSPSGRAGPPLPVPTGAVGVPIRLAEPAALAVARPGVRVDLLAVHGGDQSTGAPKPAVLATRVLVLDVLAADPTEGAASGLYLALRPDQAHRAVGMSEHTRFAIIVRP